MNKWMDEWMHERLIVEWLQDEMIELGEKEAIEAVADKEAAETAAHVALMKEANLEVRPFPSSCLQHLNWQAPTQFLMMIPDVCQCEHKGPVQQQTCLLHAWETSGDDLHESAKQMVHLIQTAVTKPNTGSYSGLYIPDPRGFAKSESSKRE